MLSSNIYTDKLRDWLLTELSSSIDAWITIDQEISKKNRSGSKTIQVQIWQKNDKQPTTAGTRRDNTRTRYGNDRRRVGGENNE